MAARFWIGGGTNTNWNASPSTNWAATSGGAVRVAAPGVTDDVTFDGAGANGNTASVVSASISCLSLTFTTGYTNTITINTAVTLTVAGNFTDRTNHTWVVNGTGLMTISAASTITSNGKTFPGPINFSGSNTKTISGDWTITGILGIATTTTTINKTTTEVISVGGFNVAATVAGTINITLTGGTWTGGANLNTISGTITLAGNVTINAAVIRISGCSLVYSSGTITTTSSTLQIDGSCTLNTSGVTWNNITIAATATVTINSLLLATGIMTVNNAVSATFAGTSVWTVATFTYSATTATTITLKNGSTYTITTTFNSFLGLVSTQPTFTSDDGTLKTILTLNPGATCNVLAKFTRIDASNGRAIHTFNGTITSCNNIFSITDALTPAKIVRIRAGATY